MWLVLGLGDGARRQPPPTRLIAPAPATGEGALCGAGGDGGWALGAVSRWAVELAVPSVGGFPLATFLINVTGAFGLGLFGVLLLERLLPTRYLRPLLGIGFLGAYTTVSTMAMEGSAAAGRQPGRVAVCYWVATLLVGQVAGVWGMWLGRLRLSGRRHGVER
jgi:CrcB protein